VSISWRISTEFTSVNLAGYTNLKLSVLDLAQIVVRYALGQ
jgi:hypothetical protein